MLATPCSKPVATKAKRHKKIEMHFAVSLLARNIIQITKQMSQLKMVSRVTNPTILLLGFSYLIDKA
jgi:hypothetical protein